MKEVLCRSERGSIIFHYVQMCTWQYCVWLLMISLLLLGEWWQFYSCHWRFLAFKSSFKNLTADASFWRLGFRFGSMKYLLRNLRAQTGCEHVLDTFFFFRLGELSDSSMIFFHCFLLGLRQISVKLSHVKLLSYSPGAEIWCAMLLIRLKI